MMHWLKFFNPLNVRSHKQRHSVTFLKLLSLSTPISVVFFISSLIAFGIESWSYISKMIPLPGDGESVHATNRQITKATMKITILIKKKKKRNGSHYHNFNKYHFISSIKLFELTVRHKQTIQRLKATEKYLFGIRWSSDNAFKCLANRIQMILKFLNICSIFRYAKIPIDLFIYSN